VRHMSASGCPHGGHQPPADHVLGRNMATLAGFFNGCRPAATERLKTQ
jgi:hypothetical protein